MRAKRTQRRSKTTIIEALEFRRLLSGPSIGINYIDESGNMQPATTYDTYDAYAGVPFHVNGIDADANSTTFPEDSDSSAAIKAEWQWNFGDPTGEYNQLNGFNAAHIYTTANATYPLTLTVTDEFGAPNTETIYVHVDVAPFDPTSPLYKESVYVAATAPTGSDNSGSSPTNAMGFSTLTSPGVLASIPSDSQILFRNGDTFEADDGFSTLNVTQSNIYIGSYSDSSNTDQPLFEKDDTNIDDDKNQGTGFIFNPTGTNVVIEGLSFENENGSVNPSDHGYATRQEKGTSLIINQ